MADSAGEIVVRPNEEQRNKMINQLQRAAESGDLNRAKELIKAGADVNGGAPGSFSAVYHAPLIYAASNYHPEMMVLLIENGADIHVKDNYALLTAASREYTRVIDALFKRGADMNFENGLPLLKAVENNCYSSVMMLVGYGADIHVRNEMPLRIACENGNVDMVQYLLGKGADPSKLMAELVLMLAKFNANTNSR